MMKSIFFLLWVVSLQWYRWFFTYSEFIQNEWIHWNTAVQNCRLNMMPNVYLLFPLPYYWHLFIFFSHFLRLADCLFRPAQIQNCIVLTLVSPVLQSVVHSATLLRGAQDRQVHGISNHYNIWWNFPLNCRNSAKPDLKIFGSYWVTFLWLMPHRFGLQLIELHSCD